jgi:hypothetical protein
VPAAIKGLKRARDESTSDHDEWRRGWCLLGDDDNWKRFGDYRRKQNIETTRDSPSISLAYEERGEGNPIYRLPLVTRIMNKIIVRDFYKSFYDYILKLRDYDRRNSRRQDLSRHGFFSKSIPLRHLAKPTIPCSHGIHAFVDER